MTKMATRLTLALIVTTSTAFAGSGGRPPARVPSQQNNTVATPAPMAPAAQTGVQILSPTQNSVVSALRAGGYKVTVDDNSSGEVNISLNVKGYNVDVWLSGCNANLCDRVTSSVGWETKQEADYELLNEWNSNYYTQAYYFENQYFIDSHFMIRGGFAASAVQAWIEKLLADAKEFESMLD